jgi:hypothetical protein
MKVAILILLMSVIGVPQSSDDLRKKYGPPVSETYTEVYSARDYNESTKLSVGVTVHYSKDKSKILDIRVEIFPYFVGTDIKSTDKELEAKDRLIKEVLDEILPADKRGKRLATGFYSGVSIFGSFERYEKVRIFYSGEEHRYADVTFDAARPECVESGKNCLK